MFHVGYIDLCKKVLRCVCYNCYKLLLIDDESNIKERIKKISNGRKRLDVLYKKCKDIKRCESSETLQTSKRENARSTRTHDGCGQSQPRLKKSGLSINAEFDPEESEMSMLDNRRTYSAEDALNILSRISDEDCAILGFDPVKSRPDWMIVQILPVAPPPVRPSIAMDSTLRQEDDLTH